MQITSITRTLALAGFAPAGKPANRQERFCSTRNSAKGSGKRAYAVLVLCAATAIALPAQTFTTLVSFDGTDGNTAFGLAGLVQATNGDLYGTTYLGGANFVCCGENGGGTVFRITPNGTLTTLYSFCPQSGCTDGAGANPNAGLVQATNGDFYGTTVNGGANGGGTVFKMTPGGSLTTLYSFCSQSGYTDGSSPYAGLVQAANGDLYGTASSGGASGNGTVFKITPSGTLTTIHTFAGYPTDGSFSTAGLIQATNGDLYGTAEYGGAYCAPSGCGTVFKMTPRGTLTTLYSFCSQGGVCLDGDSPDGELVQAADGNFYGTTSEGGGYPADSFYGSGTIFKITPGGALTTLYSFCSLGLPCADGEGPNAGLVQATNGDFYGITGYGGTISACNGGCGVVFSLSVGLGPFVETQTTSGEVGGVVKILGTDLTGATSVSFNGTAAAFTVVSPPLIAARVPVGATSGTVQVVTPSGTLSSNVPFRVLP